MTEKLDIRLIATDLDGTLFDEEKRVSERNMHALQRAMERGILLVPATGRIWQGLPECLLELPDLRYAITVNGAGVVDCVEDKTIYRADITTEEAVCLAEYMCQVGTYYDCYLDGWGYVERQYYDRISEFCLPNFHEFIRRSRRMVPDMIEFLKTQGGVQKMQMNFADMELRTKILTEMPKMFPGFAITTSVPNNIEINAAKGNKGDALAALCQYLDIPLSQVVAFGDGSNDITMLRTAGVGVAMENATEEVKAAAKYVTLTNEEDGVADFLEKYVL